MCKGGPTDEEKLSEVAHVKETLCWSRQQSLLAMYGARRSVLAQESKRCKRMSQSSTQGVELSRSLDAEESTWSYC